MESIDEGGAFQVGGAAFEFPGVVSPSGAANDGFESRGGVVIVGGVDANEALENNVASSNPVSTLSLKSSSTSSINVGSTPNSSRMDMSPKSKASKSRRQKVSTTASTEHFPVEEWAWLQCLVDDMADGGDETRRLPKVDPDVLFKIPVVERQKSGKIFPEFDDRIRPNKSEVKTSMQSIGSLQLVVNKAKSQSSTSSGDEFTVGSAAALNFDGSLDAFWPSRLRTRDDLDESSKHWSLDEKEAMGMIVAHQLAEIRHQESLDFVARRPVTRVTQKRKSLLPGASSGGSEAGVDAAPDAAVAAADAAADAAVDEEEDDMDDVDSAGGEEEGGGGGGGGGGVVLGEDLSALLKFDKSKKSDLDSIFEIESNRQPFALTFPPSLTDGAEATDTAAVKSDAAAAAAAAKAAGVKIRISDEEKKEENEEEEEEERKEGEEKEAKETEDATASATKEGKTSALLPATGALQVFGPTVLPTMEEIVVGQALDHYREAVKNMNGVGYEIAIRRLNKALHLKPLVIDFYKRRSEAYLQICDFPSAMEDIKKVISLDPDAAPRMTEHLAFVTYFWGRVLFDQHLFADSLDAFSRAAQMQPNVIAYQARSFACLASLGRHKECLSLVNRAIGLNSDNADLYIMRARLHQLSNRITECYYDVRESLELDPTHSEALKLLRGIEARASALMMSAVQMDLRGKFQAAAGKISLAIQTNPSVAVFHNIKGALHRKKLEFNDAIDDYLVAIDKSGNPADPVFQDAHRQLVLTYNDFAIQCYTSGAYDDAVSLLNKAVNAEKNQKGLYINRGDCFLRLEEYLFALSDYKQALDLDPTDRSVSSRIAFIYHHYGLAMTRERQHEDAVAYFEQAIEFDPLVGRFFVAMATATANSGRPPEEVKRHLLKAVAVVGVENGGVVPLLAKMFPGKTEEQIFSLPEFETAAREVGDKIDAVLREGRRSKPKRVEGVAAATDAAGAAGAVGDASASSSDSTNRITKRELARCDGDSKFFKELIEGRRMVNKTVKKLLKSRSSESSDSIGAFFSCSSSAPGAPNRRAAIQAMAPPSNFERRGGGLDEILGDGTKTRPATKTTTKKRTEAMRTTTRTTTTTAKTRTTTSASSGVSVASTEWKTLVKKIHRRNVKRFTQV